MIVWKLRHSDMVQLLLRFREVFNRLDAIKSNVEDACVEKSTSFFFWLFIPCIFCTYCNKVTNGCNCLFCVFISFILPYMFRALINPSSGVSQAVFYVYNHLVHVVFMLLICVCLWTGLSWWFSCTSGSGRAASAGEPPRQTSPQTHADEQHKHHMNQMVVYIKNSLRHP